MNNQVKAGFGKVDITPRVGVELCGYGPYLNRNSTSILEPLYARAMAVELDGVRWVIVSCDLVGIDEHLCQEIRQIVAHETGLSMEAIMVHSTHTHSGPCAVRNLTGWGTPDDFYLELLPGRVAKAAIVAVRSMNAATFKCAEVEAEGFSYNRELPSPGRDNDVVLAGSWKTAQPEETDVTATVIRVEHAGSVAGFLTYFSCHPVVCGSLNRETHGDFVGIATNMVERQFPGAIGLFLQGALGDINSNFVHGPQEQSLTAVKMFGARFAEVIQRGLEAGEPLEIDRVDFASGEEPLTSACTSLEELQKLLSENEDLIAKFREGNALRTESDEYQEPDEHKARRAVVFVRALRKILNERKNKERQVRRLPVQSLRLGSLTFTALPLEIMHRIKRRFQAQAGKQALLLSVTNGLLGYAPLREYYQTPPVRYSAFIVPIMLGQEPFTENFEDEVFAAALKTFEKIKP